MAQRITRAHDHDLTLAHETLQRLRTQLAIPSHYTIHIELVCREEMPGAYGSVTWDYLPNRAYLIKVRCNLDPDELEWVILHELFELMTGDLAQFTADAIKTRHQGLLAFLDAQHRQMRDATIEWLCFAFLGKPRPLLFM